MKNNQTAADRDRAIYKATKEILKREHGTAADLMIVSPSFLRVEQALANNKSVYSFDVKKNGNEAVTEVKLDRNDLFVVSRIGIFLINQLSTTVGKEVLQSYPNNTIFTATGAVPADLEAFYNGSTSLKIANRVNIENLSNLAFRFVPTTQQSSSTTKSETNIFDATYPPAAVIELHGTMDIQIQTTFPTYSSIALQPTDQATNGTNKLVFLPIGFLVKGGAGKK